MTVTAAPAPAISDGIAIESRKTRPVLGWAVVGLGFLALETYIFGAWILSGPERTPNGPSPIPTWMKITTPTLEVLATLSAIVWIYYVVIRPWRRQGHLSLDGLFTLAFLTLFWLDPMSNLVQTNFTYNTTFFNFGSWVNYIPGWIAPRNDLIPEPLLFAFPLYASVVFGGVVLANYLMRKAQTRWPQLGKLGLVAICFLSMVILDCIMEPAFMVLAGWTYPSAIHGLTVFQGRYFQFPIYEAIYWGGAWTVYASLRYFRDDRGQTIVERGIERVRGSARKKTFLRFCALVGVITVITFAFYEIPMWMTTMHAHDWPQDIRNRSYLTDGICGPGTDYACPGRGVPIPRPDSVHVTPGGKSLVPARQPDEGRR